MITQKSFEDFKNQAIKQGLRCGDIYISHQYAPTNLKVSLKKEQGKYKAKCNLKFQGKNQMSPDSIDTCSTSLEEALDKVLREISDYLSENKNTPPEEIKWVDEHGEYYDGNGKFFPKYSD